MSEVLDTVEAWQVDVGDFIIINGEECTVTNVTDEKDLILIQFEDEFSTTDELEADPYETFQIWGN